MSTTELTPRQQAVLDYLRDYQRKHDTSPTVREILKHFGFRSPNGVICHLRALEKKGHIIHRPKLSRGIRLTEQEQRWCIVADDDGRHYLCPVERRQEAVELLARPSGSERHWLWEVSLERLTFRDWRVGEQPKDDERKHDA